MEPSIPCLWHPLKQWINQSEVQEIIHHTICFLNILHCIIYLILKGKLGQKKPKVVIKSIFVFWIFFKIHVFILFHPWPFWAFCSISLSLCNRCSNWLAELDGWLLWWSCMSCWYSSPANCGPFSPTVVNRSCAVKQTRIIISMIHGCRYRSDMVLTVPVSVKNIQ